MRRGPQIPKADRPPNNNWLTDEQLPYKKRWEAELAEELALEAVLADEPSSAAPKGGDPFQQRVLEATGEKIPFDDAERCAWGLSDAKSEKSKCIDRVEEQTWGYRLFRKLELYREVRYQVELLRRKRGIKKDKPNWDAGLYRTAYFMAAAARRVRTPRVRRDFWQAVDVVEAAYLDGERGLLVERPSYEQGRVGYLQVRANAGLRILDPHSGTWCTEHAVHTVLNSPYWRRRINDGDVTMVSP